jgi:uncharacterized protein DUF6798
MQRCLEVILLFAVFFVVGGAAPSHRNESHYLCKAKHYWQPDWCQGSLFLESSDAHLPFYWSVGWLTKWYSLPVVAWIGRVVAWGLLAWAWQRLVRTIVQRPYFSVLAGALFVELVEHTHFAGEWIVGGVEAKCFSYVFVLLGLEAVSTGKWKRCWPMLGIASAFHPVVGGWSVVASAVVWLTEPVERRPKWSTHLPFLLLGGILALPGLLPALALTHGVDESVVDEARQIYVFDRLPHHLAPLTHSAQWLFERASQHGPILLGLFLLAYCIRRIQSSKLPGGHSQPLPQAEYHSSIGPRSASTGPTAATMEQEQRHGEEQSQFHDDSAIRLARMLRFAWATVGLSLMGLSIEVVFWNHPSIAARLLRFYWFRLADIAVPLATSLAVVYVLAWLIWRNSRWKVPALLVAVLLPGWFLLSTSTSRWFDACPPGEDRLLNYRDWQQACRWARDNTPINSMFLVPKRGQTFQWHAHRPDVVNWKDIPQDAEGIVAWRDRYADTFYPNWFAERTPTRSLASQGTRRVTTLAERYHASHVITANYPPLQLPVVYINNTYTIYRMRQ